MTIDYVADLNEFSIFHSGGSTNTNAMLYICGTDRDYDGWAALGNPGWDYNSILPYIKRSEGNTDSSIVGNGTYHGTAGNMTITTYKNTDEIIQILQNGFVELGYRNNLDYNARQYNGFFKLQGTVRGGERCSTYRAFIAPVKNFTNLYIMKNSVAIKINFNATSATGLVVQTKYANCSLITLKPTKELIISAGGYGSPKLLLLSGIGNSSELSSVGVTPVKQLSVGRNLDDHPYHESWITINPNAPNQTVLDILWYGQQYFFYRNDTFSEFSPVNAQGIINTTDPNDKYPNIQYMPYRFPKSQEYMAEILSDFGYKDEYVSYLVDLNLNYELLLVYTVVLNPFSRGTLKLRSNNPKDDPIIDTGFFTDPRDRDTVIEGIRVLERLINTTAFANTSASFVQFDIPECDGLTYASYEYRLCEIKYLSNSNWHPAGTCKMGNSSDPTAVVDSNLRLRGYNNVRVADASIMPYVTSGNTQCPTFMIGQKAADLIRSSWP